MPKPTKQIRESTLRTRLVAADEQLRRLAHLGQLLEIQREGGPHGAFTDASGAVHYLEHLVELAGETLAGVRCGAARKGPALLA